MTTSKNRVFPQSYNRTIVPLKKHCAFDNLKQPKMDIARADRRIFFLFVLAGDQSKNVVDFYLSCEFPEFLSLYLD